MQRLIPSELLKHHWASLVDRSGPRGHGKRDWPAVVILIGGPLSLGAWAWHSNLTLTTPNAMLPALSLLSAGLLAAFGQIASIRAKYELPDSDYDPDWRTREMLDEAVAHILTAALVAVVTAIVIIVGMNLSPAAATQLPVRTSALTVTLGSYLVLVFFMVVRKLWGAYEVANKRDQERHFLRR